MIELIKEFIYFIKLPYIYFSEDDYGSSDIAGALIKFGTMLLVVISTLLQLLFVLTVILISVLIYFLS